MALPIEEMGSGPRTPSVGVEEETIKKNLFKRAMEGDWKEVVNLYKKHPEVHKAKITRSGDTALHIAVSDGQEDVVEELVELSSNEALKVQNERGNTPLHFAASLGNARMCMCIASKDPEDPEILIGVRNNDSETPFFLAALHGKKDAFLCLHSLCGSSEQGYLYCRRNDGETVLHSAISGDYFDLAFQIIHKYDKLVNYVNEQGFSPLHLLATKPTAFRSGSHLVWFHRIIYHCIFVDELVVDTSHEYDPSKPSEDGKNPTYPENYHTCINFFRLLLKIYHVLVRGGKGKQKNDEEADAKGQVNSNQQGNQSSNRTHGHQQFPINYAVCFDTLKLISKAMLFILGLGSREIKNIPEEKKEHTWSVQIMNELLNRVSIYEYDDKGQKPQHLSSYQYDETTPYSFPYGGNIDFSTGSITSPEHDDNGQMPMANSSSEVNQSQGGKSNGKNGDDAGEEKKNTTSDAMGKRETPLLVAAKNGITEMVERILELFPVAIHDMNYDKKNIVLLAVENRQPHVYLLLLKKSIMREDVFRKVDSMGNSALHLAAKLGEHRAWRIPGALTAVLQIQWEIKWYEFVKYSMPMKFFATHNKAFETPMDVFIKSHSELLKDRDKWFIKTSESCSVVVALIITVAFASSSSVPGGFDEKTGSPTLKHQPAFMVFAIASFVALCFSTISLVAFLGIITSRQGTNDFFLPLPRKFPIAVTTLLVSIVAMLVSFCSSHFFLLKDSLQITTAYPLYAVLCLGASLFVVFEFPESFAFLNILNFLNFLNFTFSKVPPRSYKLRQL